MSMNNVKVPIMSQSKLDYKFELCTHGLVGGERDSINSHEEYMLPGVFAMV